MDKFQSVYKLTGVGIYAHGCHLILCKKPSQTLRESSLRSSEVSGKGKKLGCSQSSNAV